MSFYGNIKRVDSSPWIFDKIYPNRAAMYDENENVIDDGVYIGRYVLVKYTYNPNPAEGEEAYFSKYVETEETETKSIDPRYSSNAAIDIGKYNQTYDNTVWQKIYSVGKEKYILIAELNAAAPRLNLETIAPKYLTSTGEVWNNAEINEAASSEDMYIFKMPDVLKLEVGNIAEDFYGKLLMNPAWHTQLAIDEDGVLKESADGKSYDATNGTVIEHSKALGTEYNYMEWTPYKTLDDNGNCKDKATNVGDDIIAKKLDTKLYAFGQMISDMYDVLYGKPSVGSGFRPFYVDDDEMAQILDKYDKGLIGILASIATENRGDASQDIYGSYLPSGMNYYFTTKWADASDSPDSFIENIPRVVTGSDENEQANGHYFINLANNELHYIGG